MVAMVTTVVFAGLVVHVATRTTGPDDRMVPEKRLFAWSILYLFIVFGAVVADKWIA